MRPAQGSPSVAGAPVSDLQTRDDGHADHKGRRLHSRSFAEYPQYAPVERWAVVAVA
jgi:hypothetical protein